MRKKIILSIVLLSILAVGFYFLNRYNFLSAIKPNKAEVSKPIIKRNYTLTKSNIIKIKSKLSANEANEKSVSSFINILTDSIFSQWYGTKWDFYGTTQIPNEGKIACGYFVTTTLQDAGVKLQRSKLAQLASEEMIKTLVRKSDIHRFSNYKIDKFNSEIKKLGKGLYVIGLDNHTGFILNKNDSVFFIHSSGIYPYCVMKEYAPESKLLVHSKYRVVGKISTPTFLKEHWF